MSGSSKQDPLIKGNPFSVTWDQANKVWRVQSANPQTPRRFYHVDAEAHHCDCDAPGYCWHKQIIRLADEIESVQASARSYYASWRLADLRAEDARLRAEVARAETSAIPAARQAWFERAQLSVVGDEILDRLVGAEVAA